MARVYVFADEGGDLVFKRGVGISQYFVIGTATMPDPTVGTDLLELRRELAWNGVVLPEFHAHNDKQRVRDRLFDVIVQSGVRVDATVLDKTKTQDHLRADPLRFYKEAWYLHFKYVAPRVCGSKMSSSSSRRHFRSKGRSRRSMRQFGTWFSRYRLLRSFIRPSGQRSRTPAYKLPIT